MTNPHIFVIDEDLAVCRELHSLLLSVGLPATGFGSTDEFLDYPLPDTPSCLILDARQEGANGLDFPSSVGMFNSSMPVIVTAAHIDISTCVKVMKAGALHFLTKPLGTQELLDAVVEALAHDRERRARARELNELRDRFNDLTTRERDVMSLATRGLMNKHIAAELELSEATVKLHRGNVMKKMRARTFADLVRMAHALSTNQLS